MRFRIWAVVPVVALVGVLTTTGASPAGAHAFLTSSNPADGAVLTTAPTQLRLDFSESVVVEATHITITDSAGKSFVPTGLRVVTGEDTEAPSHVVANLPALARSAYRLSWRTLSSDDLHLTRGTLVFGLNAPVAATPFVEPRPRLEESSLRWLLFLSLAVALGGQLAIALLRRTGADGTGRLRRRCRRLAAAGAAGGALAAGGLLIDQLVVSQTSLARLFSGQYGERWLLREVGFALLLAAALVHLDRTVARRMLVTLGALAACLGSALLGHSGSAPDAALTRTVADAAHLGAAAVWAGFLLVTVAALLPGSRTTGTTAVRAALRAFALPAAACVSVMVVTGVYLASGVVGSIDAALFTVYGRVLLIKLGLVAVVAALGAVNSLRLHPRGRRAQQTPRRTVWAEAVSAVLVLAAAAVLTSGQPAREPEFVSNTALSASVPIVDTAVADLQESLAVRPNLPGRNVVLVGVFDTRRPAPAPIRRVLVAVAGTDGALRTPTAADRLADGEWSVAVPIGGSGRTRFVVTVERAGLRATTHEYVWTVGGAAVRTRPATVSTAPIGGPLRALAAALLVAIALAWAVALALAGIRRTRYRGSVSLPPDTEPSERSLELVDVT